MLTTWARTNPCSMSLWMRPAACLAFQPRGSCRRATRCCGSPREEGDVAEHLVGGAQDDVERAGLVGAELRRGTPTASSSSRSASSASRRAATATTWSPRARPSTKSGVLLKRGRRPTGRHRCSARRARAGRSPSALPEQGGVVGRPRNALRQLAVEQFCVQRLEDLELVLRGLVAAARRLAGLVQAALHELHVAEHESVSTSRCPRGSSCWSDA